MKLIRYQTGTGNGAAVVPGGQVQLVTMVPGDAEFGGSWMQVNEGKRIWVPGDTTLTLDADTFAACCGPIDPCDQYPGDHSVRIIFGTDPDDELSGDEVADGDPPESWLVFYNGC